MSGIVSLIDNKLLKLPDETIPLGAISSISTNYEVPHKVIGILLVIIGGLIAYNSGNVTDESRLAAAWGGVIIFAIGFGLIHIRRHFLLINLHSGRTVRIDVHNKELFEAQREIENALLGLPAGAVVIPPKSSHQLPSLVL